MIKPVEIDHISSETNLHNTTWKINNKTITLKNVATKEAIVTALNDIYTCLIDFKPKEPLINKIGLLTIQKISIAAYFEETEDYLKHFKNELARDRNRITKGSLKKRVFGDVHGTLSSYEPYQNLVSKVIWGLTSESATLIKPIKIERLESKLPSIFCVWKINNNEVQVRGSSWNKYELITALNNIYTCLISFTPKEHLVNRIGLVTIQKLTIAAYPYETEAYLKYFKNKLTKDNSRIALLRKSLTKKVFGEVSSSFSKFHEPYRNLVMKVLGRSFTSEKIALIKPIEIEHIGWENKAERWIINGHQIAVSESTIERLIYLLNNIYSSLINQKSIDFLREQIGIRQLQKLMTVAYPEELNFYLKTFSESLIGTDHTLKKAQLEECIFGTNYSISHWYKPFANIFFKALSDADKHNTALKIKSNTIDIERDQWTLFYTSGSQLRPIYYNFSTINANGIKREVKYYIKNFIDNAKPDEYINIRQRFYTIRNGLRYLIEQYPDVKNIASFKQTQVKWFRLFLETEAKTRLKKTKYTPGSINKIFIELRLLVDWLMETDVDIKTPIPRSNIFARIFFPNMQSKHKRTEYIPEEVIEQLFVHINDIPNVMAQRMFLIMMNTGFRYKEVSYLEDDCLIYDNDSKVWLLRYIPWKVLESRRKYGISDYAFTRIKDFVLEEIKFQMKDSEDLRLIWGLNKIFLQQYCTLSPKMYSVGDFNRALNILIKKNNIIDIEGNLWHFTSKQCRKTVAVDMITNGATMHEVAQQLQHLDTRTTSQYYAEVRKMRLAKMNNEFYKKKFGLYISDAQLSRYNEEERKILYVQFCLGEREVELGKCIKHPNDGPCSKRSGKTNCANCKQLCTGKQNLPKWLALRNSAQLRVDALIVEYKQESISDYEDFREYQAAVYELKTYLDIIARINGEENT